MGPPDPGRDAPDVPEPEPGRASTIRPALEWSESNPATEGRGAARVLALFLDEEGLLDPLLSPGAAGTSSSISRPKLDFTVRISFDDAGDDAADAAAAAALTSSIACINMDNLFSDALGLTATLNLLSNAIFLADALSLFPLGAFLLSDFPGSTTLTTILCGPPPPTAKECTFAPSAPVNIEPRRLPGSFESPLVSLDPRAEVCSKKY